MDCLPGSKFHRGPPTLLSYSTLGVENPSRILTRSFASSGNLNLPNMATIQFCEGLETPPTARFRSKQLLNNIVDGMANTRPWALYAEVPRASDTYEAGYRTVTYGRLANAINGVAWYLKEKLGESRDHQTLSYIGPNDLAYVMMILGACKAGFKVRRSPFWAYCRLITGDPEAAACISSQHSHRQCQPFCCYGLPSLAHSSGSAFANSTSNTENISTSGFGQPQPRSTLDWYLPSFPF